MGLFDGLKSAVEGLVTGDEEKAKEGLDEAAGAVTDAVEDAFEAGAEAVADTADAVTGAPATAMDSVKSVVQDPGSVIAGLGAYAGTSFESSMDSAADVADAVQAVVSDPGGTLEAAGAVFTGAVEAGTEVLEKGYDSAVEVSEQLEAAAENPGDTLRAIGDVGKNVATVGGVLVGDAVNEGIEGTGELAVEGMALAGETAEAIIDTKLPGIDVDIDTDIRDHTVGVEGSVTVGDMGAEVGGQATAHVSEDGELTVETEHEAGITRDGETEVGISSESETSLGPDGFDDRVTTTFQGVDGTTVRGSSTKIDDEGLTVGVHGRDGDVEYDDEVNMGDLVDGLVADPVGTVKGGLDYLDERLEAFDQANTTPVEELADRAGEVADAVMNRPDEVVHELGEAIEDHANSYLGDDTVDIEIDANAEDGSVGVAVESDLPGDYSVDAGASASVDTEDEGLSVGISSDAELTDPEGDTVLGQGASASLEVDETGVDVEASQFQGVGDGAEDHGYSAGIGQDGIDAGVHFESDGVREDVDVDEALTTGLGVAAEHLETGVSEGAAAVTDAIVDAVPEELADAVEVGADTVDWGTEKLADLGGRAGEAAAQGAEKAVDFAGRGRDAARGAAERAGESAEDAGEWAAERAENAVEKVAEKVVDFAERGRDAVGEVAESVGDSSGRLGERMGEAAEKVVERVSESVDRVGGKVSEAVENAVDDAFGSGAVDPEVEARGEVSDDQAAEGASLGETEDEAGLFGDEPPEPDEPEGFIDTVVDQLEDLAESLGESIGDAVESVQDFVEDLFDDE